MLNHIVATAFEEAAWQFVATGARAGKWSFLPERIGSWLSHDARLDALSFDRARKTVLIGECKWSADPVGTDILEGLKCRAGAMVREKSGFNEHD